MKQRDYQARLTDEILTAAKRGDNVLCVAPTGAGKTAVQANVAARRPGRVIALAPWRTLIDQTVESFARWGVDSAPHMAGRKGRQARVQVASIETLARHPLPPAATLMIDECHRADTADRRRLVARHLARGGSVVGFTATPWTDRGSVSGYDLAAVGPAPGELVDRGLLRRPRFYLESHRETLERVDGQAKGILFYQSVAASKRAVAELREMGLPADHLDGSTRGAPRVAALRGFKAGTVRFLTNCQVLTEGFDDTVDLVGLRSRAMNLRLFVQAVGRGIRPNGDREAAVSDPGGLCATYGSPLELPWPLWRRKGAGRPERRQACPECRELVLGGRIRSHGCRGQYDTPAPPELGRVAQEAGLGAVWQAEQWAARGRPWGEGRAAVIAELEADQRGRDLGPGWVRARLLTLGL